MRLTEKVGSARGFIYPDVEMLVLEFQPLLQ